MAPRPEESVKRSILALIITATVAFVLVATASRFVARDIARSQALAEATRSARQVANLVFAPGLPAVINGDRVVAEALRLAVQVRSADGAVVRVKVWSAAGTVIWSDAPAAVGRTFQVTDEIESAIDRQQATATVSDLRDPENVTERGLATRLVEVYIPLTLDDGTQVVFEMYSTDARLRASERRLTTQLEVFAAGALFVLLLTQLPVAVWLIRRVGYSQAERSRLMGRLLAASGRERRAIAGDLHDGVVQNLAGAGYAMEAVARALPAGVEPRTRDMLELSSAAVQRSVHELRTLIVDIHPPALGAGGLEIAFNDLADRLRESAGVEVHVQVVPTDGIGPETAALLYRCARECLANIAKHAGARRATVSLTRDADTVRLEVGDDGRGLPAEGYDRRAEGHVGLSLLVDAARDLGGHLDVTSSPAGGTTIVLVLPTGPVPAPHSPGARRRHRR